MLEPIKFLFILTGASTYLVTKYIKIDDPSRSDNATFHNDSWSDLNRSANAIARLANNSSQQLFDYAVHTDVAAASNLNGSMAPRSNRFHNNQASSSSYHIALIAPTNGTQSPALLDRSAATLSTATAEDNGALISSLAEEQFRPTFMIEINEEDDRLPKRLFQISLSNEDSRQVLDPVTYFLDGEGADKFTINATSGEIFLLRPLDRDRPLGRPQWKLNAYAKNSQSSKTLGYADIVVRLRDINDNSPKFSQAVYQANITENATAHQHVIQVQAEDFDDPNQGGNALVTYAIETNQIDPFGGVIFAIDSQSGLITTLSCCLDRERRDNYTIRVTATDGGGLKSSALVNIRLLDLNDEPPHFTRKEWHVEVEESDSERALDRTGSRNGTELPGRAPAIARLTVLDNDLPATNQFNFTIVSERHSRHFERMRDADFVLDDTEIQANYSSHFLLTANSDGSASLRILKPLDYEVATQRFISLKVAVTDKKDDFTDRFHRDVCAVYIKVRDENDNKPKFAQSFINVTLAENAMMGTIITKFYATDADQNGHSQVLYSLDGETNRKRFFSINSEGFVRLNRPLDRETVPTHIVKVIASDTDEPPLTSTATLVVNVEDCNDNAPQLINSNFLTMENSPPSKLGELIAVDADDYSKGNGPPFTFFLAADASEQIRNSFRLEMDFKGEGKAVLYSKVPFDREAQKQYIVPVVIRDSGYPSLSSIASIVVNVGDRNDNQMKDNGFKDVTVYCITQQDSFAHMQSLRKPIEIGRVNVEDPDDWDEADKMFFWSDDEVDSNFYLDSESGMVSLKNWNAGHFELKFRVFDKHHQQQAHSTMHVTVENIPLAAVINSASLRIVGLDSFDFIAVWDWKTRRKVTNLKEKLENRLKEIIDCDVLEIFSIMDKADANTKMLDVRYFAKSRGRFLSAVYMNGIVQLKSDLINQLPLNVSQVGINECMHEERHPCESSSCFTEVAIDWTSPSHLVHANFTSFVGVRLLTEAKCTCYYDNLLSHFDQQFCDIDQTLCSSSSYQSDSLSDSCHLQDRMRSFTRKYLTSITNMNFEQCVTNRDLIANSRSFKGNGWIWLDPFPLCTKSFISVQIATAELNGVIFYYGSLNSHPKDFILLELLNGKLRLLFDFGSGIGEVTLSHSSPLNDGNWHQIDLHFDTSRVQLVLDTCVHSAQTRFDGVEIDLDKCSNSTTIPSFSELLNVNGPLQVGGIYSEANAGPTVMEKLNPAIGQYYQPNQSIIGFTGCIRNLIFNSHIYDLIEVHHSHNSHVGCYSTKSLCSFLNKKCRNNGVCDGNYNRVKCICNPGYYGADCSRTSEAVMFEPRSFIHLSMVRLRSFQQGSIESDQRGAQFTTGFATQIVFTFRTRQTQAEIVRLVGKGNQQTYCVVEIRDSRLVFRFKLNPVRSKSEKVLIIDSFVVNDGKWHRVEAYRFGESAFLTLDKGGIGKSARVLVDHRTELADSRHQVFELDEHQILLGGQPHYLAIGVTTVTNDYAESCLNDLKINDVHISLSDLLRSNADLAKATASVESATEERWPQSGSSADGVAREDTGPWTEGDGAIRSSITAWQNVRPGCQPSRRAPVCANVHCSQPRICVDEWLMAACRCPSGYLESEDGKNCTRTSELCKSNPCLCRRQPEGSAAWDGAQDSAKLSRLFSSGDNRTNCDQPDQEIRQPTTVNARIFQLEYGLFVVVLIALVPLNIPFLIYIAYICCRNKRSRASTANTNRVADKSSKAVVDGGGGGKSQPCSLNDDIRENIVCYRDEGGEGDVGAYDMIALRIQIQPGNLVNNVDPFDSYSAGPTTTRDKSSVNFNTWQELTVI